ncbi:MGDG synthase family glycosyltransferase [Desulfuribacillus alkaliarsenatis]|uniref:Galactosyldiacylglycerol synthase n=1 Tax=Desulfuribacillus alkaliarsenatis TaxID=766136 RepID=A0A1E5G202_9FIRM|nr:glycosyltransferase [Desulfuribacillus alkaliarsenatis]OEF97001.1 hypothetical protein BHF68_05210 [Desulfuribacillus alkaliarsenatis]
MDSIKVSVMPKRILILSEAFGLGHTMVAKAIKDSMLMHEPSWHVDVFEASTLVRPTTSRIMSLLYLKSLQYTPSLWGKIYHKSQHKPLNQQLQFLMQHMIYTRFDKLIAEYKPDLIICTHLFPSLIVSKLKKNGLRTKLCTVITDFCLHGSWLSNEVDHYLLPTETIRNELLLKGIKTEKLHVTGIPVHPKFQIESSSLSSKKAFRELLQLQDMPTLICMGGGLGVGLSESMVKVLEKYLGQMQVLFIAGKNHSLYRNIMNLSVCKHENFHLYSFVDYIDRLMKASDVMVTKPGGVTCSEAIRIGLPMLILNPLPGQEQGNLHYMLEHRHGLFIEDERTLDLQLQSLILKPEDFSQQFSVAVTKKSAIFPQGVEQVVKSMLF